MASKEAALIEPLLHVGNMGKSRLWRNNVGIATFKHVSTKRIRRVSYGVGGSGASDLVGMRAGGQFVAIEVKSSKKMPLRPNQKQFLLVVKGCGGYAAVCYPENLDLILGDLTNQTSYGMIE